MKFIFEVRVKPGYSVEEYAEAWVRASEVIQRTPGARGTYLHRKIGDPEHLLAIAHWDSKAARDAKDDHRDAVVHEILARHALTCEFNFIGEFEEPEWEVVPEIAPQRLGFPTGEIEVPDDFDRMGEREITDAFGLDDDPAA